MADPICSKCQLPTPWERMHQNGQCLDCFHVHNPDPRSEGEIKAMIDKINAVLGHPVEWDGGKIITHEDASPVPTVTDAEVSAMFGKDFASASDIEAPTTICTGKPVAWSVGFTVKPNFTTSQGAGMYERFTDRARKVMQLANQEAERFNQEEVHIGHVVLGLIKEGSGIGGNVLKMHGHTLESIRSKMIQGDSGIILGRRNHSEGVKKLVANATEEARDLGHTYVGTEHLLLGAIRMTEVFKLGLMSIPLREGVLSLLGVATAAGLEQARSAYSKAALDHHEASVRLEAARVVLDKLLTDWKETK